jgi:hypothetical protein
VDLLEAYSRLQRFKPKLHPDAKSLEASVMGPDLDMRRSAGSCASCVIDIHKSASLGTLERVARAKLVNFSGQPKLLHSTLGAGNGLLTASF